MEECDETKTTTTTATVNAQERGSSNNNLTKEQTKSEERKPAFICGVIEGFYGRPWTTEQRKDLFRK